MGARVFELGNPEWRGARAVLEIQVDGGGGVKKPCLPSWGCGFFSGITQSDHACLDYLSHETYAKYSD